MRVQPIKAWLSITDQIAKLRLRGMHITDDASALIGYQRSATTG